MSRGRRERRKAAESVALGVAAAVVLLALGAGAWWWQSGRQSKAPPAGATQAALPAASFVGRQVCGQCHEQAERRWRGSHHDLAMQPATEASVAGDFKNTRFTYAGVTSSFFRRDGKFVVQTDGPDGKLYDYDITCQTGRGTS